MAVEQHYLKQELYELIKTDSSIFDFLHSGSLDGIWYWDLENPENEWMSERFWTTLGYNPKERKHLAAEWQDLISPDDLQVALKNFEKHCADPTHPYDQVVRYRHNDGSTVWVRCRGLAIRDKAGKPVRMLGAHTNLTQHKKVEQELRRNEEKFKLITLHSADVIYKVDIATEQYTYASPSVERIFGYTQQEILGLKARDTATPESYAYQRKKLENALLQGLQEPELLELDILTKDGRVIPVEIHAQFIFNDQGLPEEILGVARDITKRKATEKALKNSEERYRTLINTMQEGLVGVDVDWRIHFVNNRFAEMSGYNVDELTNKPFFDLLSVESKQIAQKEHDRRKAGKTGMYELELVRSDGKKLFILCSPNPSYDSYGNYLGGFGVISDITERKRVEKRITSLSRLKEDLLHPGDLHERLECITRGVVSIFDADFARIWVIERGDLCESGCPHAVVSEGPHVCRQRDRCLHLMASSGRYTHIDGETHHRVPFGCYKIGRVASGKEPGFLTNDVLNDPRVHDHEWAARLGLVSFAGYRILSPEGAPVGVLALFSKHAMSVQEQSLLESVAGTAAHVIQVSGAEEALRESEQRARKQRAALVQLTLQEDSVGPDTQRALRRICEVLADSIDVARTSVWRLSVDGSELQCLNLYEADKNAHSHGAVINAKDIPKYFDAIRADSRIYAEDAQNDPRTDELTEAYLKPLGITSMLDAGIVMTGNLFGVVCCEHVGRMRKWHADEESFVSTIAALVAQTLAESDRKQARQALRNSEYRFRGLVESSSDWIWEVDSEGHYTYVSPRIEAVLGFSPDEAIGKTAFDFMPPEEADRVGKIFRDFVARGKPIKALENVNLHKDGRRIVLETSGVPIRDSARNIRGYRGVDRDITERKEAERLLQESQRRYQEVFQSSRDGFVLVDVTGQFVDANDAYCNMLGYTLDELREKSDFYEITPEKWHKWEQDEIWNNRILKDGHSGVYEKEYIRKDGSVFPVELHAYCVFDESGQPEYMWGVARDITDRKQAEEALRASEEEYRTLIESSHEVVFSKDRDGHYHTMNLAAAFGLGKERIEDAEGKTDYDLLPKETADALRKADMQVMESGELIEVEEVVHSEEGGDRIYLSRKWPTYDSEGKVGGIACFALDITERKEAERALEERARILQHMHRKVEVRNAELQKALDEIATLRGILPICSFCKKVRDDEGYWQQVDMYIRDHTEAEISHGICPDCLKEHYPDLSFE